MSSILAANVVAVNSGKLSKGSIPFWDTVADTLPSGASASFLGTTKALNGVTIGTDAGGHPITISPEGAVFAPNPWDQVSLAGHLLPGVCSAKGLPTLAVDKKKAGGVDGATITVQGYLPGPIEIESLIWTPGQWAEWQTIIGAIWRKPAKKSKVSDLAISVYTPGLDWLGINLCVVLGITPPEVGPIRGTRVIKVKSIEFVDLKPYIKTARAQPKNVPLAAPLRASNNPPSPAQTDGGPAGPRPNRLGGAT